MKMLLAAALLLLVPPPALADQDSDELELSDNLRIEEAEARAAPVTDNLPTMVRGLTLPVARMGRSNTLRLTIDHRAMQKFWEDAFDDYLGLDAGALKIGIGIQYTILDWLDVQVLRQNGTMEIYDTYEGRVRCRLLDETSQLVTVILGAGGSWFHDPNNDDSGAFNGQLQVGRKLLLGFELTAALVGTTSSTGFDKGSLDEDWSMAAGGELAWNPDFFRPLRVSVEALFPVAGFSSGNPGVAAGLSYLTHRHAFSVLVTNNQLMTLNGLAAGSNRGLDDLSLGFSILRQWDF
ncbi:MAG: hypothetical protein FJ109_06330 [Deltaproteobacteria bacterium]|nr:hypothetical protein [Deltaproteobacteria bacterium]